jgi:F-type H+-transporting ATPase subunit b
MQSTVNHLVDLLITSVPTIVLFLFLTAYLNIMLFRPIGKILDERRKDTEGVRELAQRVYDATKQKASEYDRALEAARAAMHEEREAARQKWSEEQAAAIAKARAEVNVQIRNAKLDIAAQLERERLALEKVAESLSESVVNVLLQRRAA